MFGRCFSEVKKKCRLWLFWFAGFFHGFQDLSGCASGQSLPLALSPGPHPALEAGRNNHFECPTDHFPEVFEAFVEVFLENFGRQKSSVVAFWMGGILCDSKILIQCITVGPQPGQWGKCWPVGNRRAIPTLHTSATTATWLKPSHLKKKKHIKLHISIGMFTPFQFLDEQANWSQVWPKMVGSLHRNLSFDQILGWIQISWPKNSEVSTQPRLFSPNFLAPPLCWGRFQPEIAKRCQSPPPQHSRPWPSQPPVGFDWAIY